ncbi:MAG: hypothetical protein LBT86_02335 [Deltaproteobacteria bacterium]|jgi:hypothetical protein|nr:hypothetical protein [Deltaproteobacteria bacterium]
MSEENYAHGQAKESSVAPAESKISGGQDFYDRLIKRHRALVEDYSRIEARIRSLESQLEEILVPH